MMEETASQTDDHRENASFDTTEHSQDFVLIIKPW